LQKIFLNLKYLGCGTAAKTLYRQLSTMPELEVSWNSKSRDFDIVHYHTFGPLALLSRRYSQGVKILTAHITPVLMKVALPSASTSIIITLTAIESLIISLPWWTGTGTKWRRWLLMFLPQRSLTALTGIISGRMKATGKFQGTV